MVRSGPAGSVAPVRVAVLVSGSGTILQAIIEAGIPVALVIADRPCGGLAIAEEFGVPSLLVERTDFGPDFDRDGYARQMADALAAEHVDVVAMAGFGTILSEPIHHAFGGRIINTHPALLPAFKGWHAVRDALAHGVKVTGCTVHVAGLDVDTGPILAQEALTVAPDDTEDTLQERIKSIERRLYPDVLRQIIADGAVRP